MPHWLSLFRTEGQIIPEVTQNVQGVLAQFCIPQNEQCAVSVKGVAGLGKINKDLVQGLTFDDGVFLFQVTLQNGSATASIFVKNRVGYHGVGFHMPGVNQ